MKSVYVEQIYMKSLFFLLAVKKQQFYDIEDPKYRMLNDDDDDIINTKK